MNSDFKYAATDITTIYYSLMGGPSTVNVLIYFKIFTHFLHIRNMFVDIIFRYLLFCIWYMMFKYLQKNVFACMFFIYVNQFEKKWGRLLEDGGRISVGGIPNAHIVLLDNGMVSLILCKFELFFGWNKKRQKSKN